MLYNPCKKLCFLHYFWSFKKYNFDLIKEEDIQRVKNILNSEPEKDLDLKV